MYRMVAGALLASLSTACSDPWRPAPSTAAGSLTEPSVPSRPVTVSGAVFETTPAGRRPVAGAWVAFLGDTGGGTALTDGAGRYEFRDLPPGIFAAFHAYGGPPEHRHQPCVVGAQLSGDQEHLDVEYNLVNVPGTGGPPFVTGHVFQGTPSGRVPAANKQVRYYLRNRLTAYTATDANGRFEFCKVPLGPGRVSAVVDFDSFRWEDILVERSVMVEAGGAILDIDY